LQGLGVGVFEKGVVPLQFDKLVVQVVPAQVHFISLMGGFFGFQGPVVDEPAGIDGFPDARTLRLIGVEAIPEGSEHTSRFGNGVFELRDSSPP